MGAPAKDGWRGASGTEAGEAGRSSAAAVWQRGDNVARLITDAAHDRALAGALRLDIVPACLGHPAGRPTRRHAAERSDKAPALAAANGHLLLAAMRKSVWRQARERWLLPIGLTRSIGSTLMPSAGEGKKQRTRCAASETHADLRACTRAFAPSEPASGNAAICLEKYEAKSQKTWRRTERHRRLCRWRPGGRSRYWR